MLKYKIRQERKQRKPLPACKLTTEEWDMLWKELNEPVRRRDKDSFEKAKRSVRSKIANIYAKRYPNSRQCVICGSKCGWSGLCPTCWRALSSNGLLRSLGHTVETRDGIEKNECQACGSKNVYCRGLCSKCYGMMRSRGYTTIQEVIEERQKQRGEWSG